MKRPLAFERLGPDLVPFKVKKRREDIRIGPLKKLKDTYFGD